MILCVTGGAGFLGSHLVDRLVKEKHDVLIFDNLERSWKINDNAEFIKGDILIEDDVAKIEDIHIMVHLAAVCGVEACIKNPIRIINDFNGTQNVLNRCLEIGVEKVIFFSTGEIYGDNAIDVKEDNQITIWNTHEPRVSYSLSKLLSESLVNFADIESVIIRPFNIYGPRQKGAGVVRNFIEWGLKGEPIRVYNVGTEIRAMCYIDDFIDGVYAAIMKKLGHKSVFNLGNPYTARSVLGIAELVKKLTGDKSEINHIKKGYTDKSGVTPNIDKAKEILDYNPKVTLEDGVKRTVEWYKKEIL